MAYRIKPERVAEVKEYLDIREINGYTIHYTPFHPAASSTSDSDPSGPQAQPAPINTLVYIGTPDNEQFVGPQDPQALAEHIAASAGPSGPNADYLLSLDVALQDLAPDSGDHHIHDLAERVRAIQRLSSTTGGAAAAVAAPASTSTHGNITEQTEEFEKGS